MPRDDDPRTDPPRARLVTSHDEPPVSGQPAQMSAEQMKRLQEQGYFELEGLVMEQMLKTKYVLQDLDKNYKVGLECRDRLVVVERQQREQKNAVEAYAKSSEQLAVTTSQSFIAASTAFGGLRDDVMHAVGSLTAEIASLHKKVDAVTPVDKRPIGLRHKRSKADWVKLAGGAVTAFAVLSAAVAKFVDLLGHWFGGP